jgi:alpha-beta hydrolase superfamily lysophospholipase
MKFPPARSNFKRFGYLALAQLVYRFVTFAWSTVILKENVISKLLMRTLNATLEE